MYRLSSGRNLYSSLLNQIDWWLYSCERNVCGRNQSVHVISSLLLVISNIVILFPAPAPPPYTPDKSKRSLLHAEKISQEVASYTLTLRMLQTAWMNWLHSEYVKPMMCSQFDFYASVASYYYVCTVHQVKGVFINEGINVKYERGDNCVVFYLVLIEIPQRVVLLWIAIAVWEDREIVSCLQVIAYLVASSWHRRSTKWSRW